MDNKNELFDEIKKYIKSSHNVIITAHKNLDLDAIGSCLAIAEICNYFKKEYYIVKEDIKDELGVSRALTTLKNSEYITTYSNIEKKINTDTLLIVVDVQGKERIQNPKLIEKIRNIIIIDHHTVELTNYEFQLVKFIDNDSSSTCEIITDMISYLGLKLSAAVATIMLAGIKVDTNNFTLNTTDKTYHTACELDQYGADNKKIKLLLKQDLKEYKRVQKLIQQVETFSEKYAIVADEGERIHNQETLAKSSDILLNFDAIEASFTIGYIDEGIVGVSARSLGNINVGKLMKSLGGGGYISNAATQIKGKTIKEVKDQMIGVIK